MRQQLELEGMPRPRTKLLHALEEHAADTEQGLVIDGEFITYSAWMTDGQAPEHQGYYQVLLQMPDGGETGTVMGFYKPSIDKFVASVDGDEVLLQRRKGRPWRGLSKPAPFGYPFYVAGCPMRMAPEAPVRRRVALEV